MTPAAARLRGLAAWAALLAALPAPAAAGDGIAALQTAAPSCDDGSGAIYVDCGNGTVTDTRSGLVWLADADCLGHGLAWDEALRFVAGLADLPADSAAAGDDCGLADGSSPGEWRLASKSEWEAMVAAAAALDCGPAITSDDGGSCWSAACFVAGDCAFSNVQFDTYWTASPYIELGPAFAWLINLDHGDLEEDPKGTSHRAWPVRGGQ